MIGNANQNLAKRQEAAVKEFYVHLAFRIGDGHLARYRRGHRPGLAGAMAAPRLGAGLLAHAFVVFGQSPRVIVNWEARKVEAVKHRLDERASATMKGPAK